MPTLKKYAPTSTPSERNASYRLLWRQRQLIVQPALDNATIALTCRPADLAECLKRSPVALVKLDLNLDESSLRAWANACHQADKAAFLRLPALANSPQKRNQLHWKLKRIFDWLGAMVMLLILSPVMLVLALLIRLNSPGPILAQQCCIGERGKLFRVINFRTMTAGDDQRPGSFVINRSSFQTLKYDSCITPIGQWMRRYSLDKLPQLLNVLRGEMSLVGPRPYTVREALRIAPEGWGRLNALPGITGAWRVETRSELLDLNASNRGDLKYLHNWSLGQDLKVLLLALPKVLSRSSAY